VAITIAIITQVVQRIKAVADETKLLVLDEDADNYYKEHKLIVRSDMDNVDVHETPAVNPYTSDVPAGKHLMSSFRSAADML